MNKPWLANRLCYAFDNTMSKGPIAQRGLLTSLRFVQIAYGDSGEASGELAEPLSGAEPDFE